MSRKFHYIVVFLLLIFNSCTDLKLPESSSINSELSVYFPIGINSSWKYKVQWIIVDDSLGALIAYGNRDKWVKGKFDVNSDESIYKVMISTELRGIIRTKNGSLYDLDSLNSKTGLILSDSIYYKIGKNEIVEYHSENFDSELTILKLPLDKGKTWSMKRKNEEEIAIVKGISNDTFDVFMDSEESGRWTVSHFNYGSIANVFEVHYQKKGETFEVRIFDPFLGVIYRRLISPSQTLASKILNIDIQIEEEFLFQFN